ncbi:MAG TPA: ATP-dependent RecD-like DNA helicase [Candidatus Hydrogenedentes bacterium]|mgnify:CR=1 FL=1|nr:ATP-dependent RecD-like DNA helicase [Candidatus Hydrogenedentota bacterium]
MKHLRHGQNTRDVTQPNGDARQGELLPEDAPRAPDSLDMVEGVVDRIVYESAETGFFVARLRDKKTRDLVTFVGNVAAVSAGETIRIWGRWVNDPKFGRQLRMERYEIVLPNTVHGIEKYLGSGLIPGIGPEFAKRLVKAFGVDTLRVISEEPKRLQTVQGIGRKRAAQLCDAWQRQKAIQSIMLFLQGHGIGVNQAVRIYKRYGDKAVAVLRENPYRLAQDISGIAFKSADKIAEQLGVARNAPQRIEAGILYLLDRAGDSGHVFERAETLVQEAGELLGVEEGAEVFERALAVLVAREQVVREDDAVFLRRLWHAESDCAYLLRRLIATPGAQLVIQTDKAIQWVETTHSIRLSDEQRDAISTAIREKVLVITGGPGTGKTTVLNGILAIFHAKNVSMELAAPTGRAAKRMEAATGREARTIHRLLEYSPKEGGFQRNAARPLDADLIVIDEASMVDITLMQSLLLAIPKQARLILVGDVDQLPSVGPGNVLLDVIASQAVPVVWLKTVFRQAAQSGIIANAHRINKGQMPEFNTTDFFLVQRKDPVKALETVVHLVTERMPAKFGFDPKRDVQVLAPMRRGEAGVTRLNEALQQALNPGAVPIQHRLFGCGDKVMQLSNNYELDVFNGDAGIVAVVDDELREVQIAYDDRAVLYGFDDLDEVGLAYASTVHKAQGSEYPAVVMPVLTEHFLLLQRNILYTAVTRASKLVVIVGDPKAVALAVRNTKQTRRNTRLADRLSNPATG